MEVIEPPPGERERVMNDLLFPGEAKGHSLVE